MKVKEFWEEHKEIIESAAIVGGIIANCVIWYKVGRQQELKHWVKKFHGGFGNVMLTALRSDGGLYSRNLIIDGKVMKFKDLGKLAEDAINFEGSKDHLEETIKGLYVFTGRNK